MTYRFILVLLLLLAYSKNYAQEVIPLYDGKPPGSEDWSWSEQTSTENLFRTEVVYNVSQPTLTAYLPPKEAANGTAVIIAPGGAFHILSIKSEGRDVARWLNSQGVAAFVLKYRVVRSMTDDPVQELTAKMQDFEELDKVNAPVVKLATQDGLKAMEYVRDNAQILNIDPDRIGFMGFSAGATLTMSVVYNAEEKNRPNFVAPIYAYEPGILGGLQALNIALFHPEKFGYVLPLSTGYFPPQLKELEAKYSQQLRNPAINKLRLFWISMGGEQDIAYQNGQNTLALLDKYGIKYETNDYPAGHTFLTWRHDLLTFAPLLFR